jgi:hypothetical protein
MTKCILTYHLKLRIAALSAATQWPYRASALVV